MPRLFRYFGAVLILVGGVVHLYLYQQGYQSIPKIGPLFLLNVAVALVIGVALAEILTLGVLGVWFNATRPKRHAAAVLGERRAERPTRISARSAAISAADRAQMEEGEG